MQQFRLTGHRSGSLRRDPLRARSTGAPGLDGEALDGGRLEALENSCAGLLDRLVEIFLRDSVRRLSDIADGLSDKDVEKVRSAAHAFKGSAANLGARQLAAACAAVERRAENEDVDGARASATALGAEFERARAALLARCG